MAETSNIAKMATIISKQIFTKLKWVQVGPIDQNWDCSTEAHKRKTHPSDLVMYYEEPYKMMRTYVNFDLKSYAIDSINTDKINSAVHNLAKSVSCIQISPDWQNKYINGTTSFSIAGALFIYNHDGDYHKDFSKLLEKIDHNSLEIPPDCRIFVLGPERIGMLDNMATDISIMQGNKVLPNRDEDYWFHYPNLSRHIKLRPNSKFGATLEMITGPWIILEYEDSEEISKRGFVIYYNEKANSKEEFLYLIDYIQHYQMFENHKKIDIRLHNYVDNSISLFEHAIDHYAIERGGDKELKDNLKSINIDIIRSTKTRFHQEAIGMERL